MSSKAPAQKQSIRIYLCSALSNWLSLREASAVPPKIQKFTPASDSERPGLPQRRSPMHGGSGCHNHAPTRRKPDQRISPTPNQKLRTSEVFRSAKSTAHNHRKHSPDLPSSSMNRSARVKNLRHTASPCRAMDSIHASRVTIKHATRENWPMLPHSNRKLRTSEV